MAASNSSSFDVILNSSPICQVCKGRATLQIIHRTSKDCKEEYFCKTCYGKEIAEYGAENGKIKKITKGTV
jgi:protein-arginine kinase activator protein McsA